MNVISNNDNDNTSVEQYKQHEGHPYSNSKYAAAMIIHLVHFHYLFSHN